MFPSQLSACMPGLRQNAAAHEIGRELLADVRAVRREIHDVLPADLALDDAPADDDAQAGTLGHAGVDASDDAIDGGGSLGSTKKRVATRPPPVPKQQIEHVARVPWLLHRHAGGGGGGGDERRTNIKTSEL